MRLFQVLALPATPILALAAAPVPAPVDFTREVRPILAKHCFKCHGPDEAERKGGLRLDLPEAAIRGGLSRRPAIVPGKPERSELIRRVDAVGSGLLMPPAHTRDSLTAGQRDVLRRWVAAGGRYQPHWAFVAPRRPALPPVRDTRWSAHPIDRFILARLERSGLRPSPPADPIVLARRLYLDLLGFPPTPEEADAFLQDTAPGAYERLVDRLLASPHYGERWARPWLDLARYADTNGYEKDRVRSIWPYRDWVIRALNQDMPYDRFTIEQIAGDMLPGATLDQRVATGFHRNTMLNEEGGIDPLEFRFHAMTDRVLTTGTTWLGLTIGCAQCHTHKYDPISQREYYRFMAFLNNADEPEVEVPDPALEQRRRAAEEKVRDLEEALPSRFPAEPGSTPAESLERKRKAWEDERRRGAAQWKPLIPVSAKSNLPLLTIQNDGSILSSGDQTKRDVYEIVLRDVPAGTTAIRLEAIPDERLPRHGPGRIYYEGPHGDFFLSTIELVAGGQPRRWSGADHTFASGNNTAAAAIDTNPQTGWSINGGQGRLHAAVFRLAEPLPAGGDVTVRLVFERYYAAGLGRFRFAATSHPAPQALPPDVEAALLAPPEQRGEEQRALLLRHFLLAAPELKDARAEIDRARAEMPAQTTSLVFVERPPENPRPTYVHRRGEWLRPGERVEPGTPAFLHPFPAGAPRDRLHFARWLVDRANPLTARVAVNRVWAALFGRGIVRTTEDFGIQGEAPSHPELLDWLAVEFMERGWSQKQLIRLIVTSAAYRQSSRVRSDLAARDPENRLLGRAPRFRLQAELVRDTALRVSGLLSPKIGGPSVFPPQPPGVTSEGTYGPLEWKVSPGEDRYRRGLYTFMKRTAPYAMFQTFDAPSGEACVARREMSNTPLQALTLLNDAVLLEASQALGRAAAQRPGGPEVRAEWIFRRCLTRAPDPEERDSLVAFYRRQRERIANGELQAAPLSGEGAPDPEEAAAWALAARVVLNLDETFVRE